MKLLLDTHVLLWALVDDPRLTSSQVNAIENGNIYLSAASIWEIGIKNALGKLDVPGNFTEAIANAGCRQLPISWAHARSAAALPMHHSDPFDRMIIAQAMLEDLTVLSSDTKFRAYEGLDLFGSRSISA